MVLWLRCITLFHEAFSKAYEFEASPEPDITRGAILRLNLLGLAGTSSKPALDAMLAGYYSPAYGMTRNLLETWRRLVCIRLAPSVALPFFELPEESPIDEDGLPRKTRNMGLPAKVINQAFKSNGSDSDRETLVYVNAGIVHMHSGAHPSGEGLLQLFDEEVSSQRNYGPGYKRSLCAFGLKWGLSAQLWLLEELANTAPQEDPWNSEFMTLGPVFADWLESDESRLEIEDSE